MLKPKTAVEQHRLKQIHIQNSEKLRKMKHHVTLKVGEDDAEKKNIV